MLEKAARTGALPPLLKRSIVVPGPRTGNAKRGTVRQSSAVNVDISMTKKIKLSNVPNVAPISAPTKQKPSSKRVPTSPMKPAAAPFVCDPAQAVKGHFANDRCTQELTAKEQALLQKAFGTPKQHMVWEQVQSCVARAVTQALGVIDHHQHGFDDMVYNILSRTLTRLKPWIVYQNGEVHVYKIVGCSVDTPKTLVNKQTRQYAHMTTHLARLTNSPYNLGVHLSMLQLVLQGPSETEQQDAQLKKQQDTKGQQQQQQQVPVPVVSSGKKSSVGDGKVRAESMTSADGGVSSTPVTTNAGTTNNGPASASAAAAAAKKKRQTKPKLEKRPLPDGWQSWPVKYVWTHTDLPVFQMPLLTMSGYDPRWSGNGQPDAFVNEDWPDPGGCYSTNDLKLYMPLPEGLLYNHFFVFASNKQSEITGNMNWKWPDLAVPYETRHREAQEGFTRHMHEVHRGELRACHSTRTNRSTSTFILKMSKFNRYDLYNGYVIQVQYQYQPEKYPATMLFLGLGVRLSNIISLIRAVAGAHWYPNVFMPLLVRMIDRHPRGVKDWKDASVFIADMQQQINQPQAAHSKAKSKLWTEEKKITFTKSFLQNDLFPHIGLSSDFFKEKAIFLAYCIWRLLMKSAGYDRYDLKDLYIHQRYELNGLMHASFERRSLNPFYKRVDTALRNCTRDRIPVPWEVVLDQTWTEEWMTAMVTGRWTPTRKTAGASRSDAAMALKGFNPYGHIAHVRRANGTSTQQRKSNSSRQVDDYQWGRRDPSETPEGHQCGIVHSFCSGATVSAGSSMRALMQILDTLLGSDVLRPVADEFFEPSPLLSHWPTVSAAVASSSESPTTLAAAVAEAASTGDSVSSATISAPDEVVASRRSMRVSTKVKKAVGFADSAEKTIFIPSRGAHHVESITESDERAVNKSRPTKRLRSALSSLNGVLPASAIMDDPLPPPVLLSSVGTNNTYEPRVLTLKRPRPSPASSKQAEAEETKEQESRREPSTSSSNTTKRKRAEASSSRPPKSLKNAHTDSAAMATPFTFVQCDGGFVWVTRQPLVVLERVRRLRRRGEIDPFTSCHLERNILSIRVMSGRPMRPLFVLKTWIELMQQPGFDPKTVMSWTAQMAMDRGLIEFVDSLEEQTLVIAFSVDDFMIRSQWGELFTHMEIDPSWMLGINSGFQPFADHDQGPRAVLFDAMFKQVFVNATNLLCQYLSRQTLEHPQRAPCESRVIHDYNLQDVSHAHVVKKVIWNHRKNQEDAYLNSTTSKQFGFASASKTRTYVTGSKKMPSATAAAVAATAAAAATSAAVISDANAAQKSNASVTSGAPVFGVDSTISSSPAPSPPSSSTPTPVGTSAATPTLSGMSRNESMMAAAAAMSNAASVAAVTAGTTAKKVTFASSVATGNTSTFENPALASAKNRTTTLERRRYDKLENDGVPMLSQYMEPSDVIIGRTYQTGSTVDGSNEKMDDSLTVRQEDRGEVVSTLAVCNESNTFNLRKVELQTLAANDAGDKFSSKHGQKGTAQWLPSYFLPLSCEDLVGGDVYGSINGLVGRLTDGDMIEMEETTNCIRSGECIDATVFDNATKLEERRKMHQSVIDMGGHLVQQSGFINGETGRLMAPLTYGFLPFLKLKHLVQDKEHVRALGPIQLLTRQPTEGRAREGGHRIGYMESANFDACGVSEISLERLKHLSDGFPIAFCRQCRQMAELNMDRGYKYCQQCMTGDHVIRIRGVYTSKLSLQELFCMMIATYPKFVDEMTPVSYIPRAGMVQEPAGASALPAAPASTAATAATADAAGEVKGPGKYENRSVMSSSPQSAESEWLKLARMPRLDSWEYEEINIPEPQTLKTMLQTLPSLRKPPVLPRKYNQPPPAGATPVATTPSGEVKSTATAPAVHPRGFDTAPAYDPTETMVPLGTLPTVTLTASDALAFLIGDLPKPAKGRNAAVTVASGTGEVSTPASTKAGTPGSKSKAKAKTTSVTTAERMPTRLTSVGALTTSTMATTSLPTAKRKPPARKPRATP